ncbi:hypothetical protein ACFCW2_08640 [Qipengyuania sp. DSG2-2]|uniref:hypothetical protein n=1 Tax=Qipengyuania sp. DGS2-2 TaxID=3349631 RepID=UPI0036D2F7AB
MAVSESRSEVEKITSQLRGHFLRDDSDGYPKSWDPIPALLKLKIARNAENLTQFVSMLKSGIISQLNRQVDIEIFQSDDFKMKYDIAFDKMYGQRSGSDLRNFNDKIFHYRVDCWNAASAQVSHSNPSFEIDHVCGAKPARAIENPGTYLRSPIVPGIWLYSLLRTPSEGYVKDEATIFLKMGAREIGECLKRVSHYNETSQIPFTEREEIDRIYNKYVRPVYADYSKSTLSESHQKIRSVEATEEGSITTIDGLRDRFRADAESTRVAAISLLENSDLTLDDDLLAPYTLSGNARIAEIKKSLEF